MLIVSIMIAFVWLDLIIHLILDLIEFVKLMTGATDIFNRLFSNNIGPIKHARRLGLGFINSIPAARSMFIKEASGRLGELPTLLRE